jgi:hypothetical protein
LVLGRHSGVRDNSHGSGVWVLRDLMYSFI